MMIILLGVCSGACKIAGISLKLSFCLCQTLAYLATCYLCIVVYPGKFLVIKQIAGFSTHDLIKIILHIFIRSSVLNPAICFITRNLPQGNLQYISNSCCLW